MTHDNQLKQHLEVQRQAYLAEGPPSAKVRIGRIDRIIDLLMRHADGFVETLRQDFGHRSQMQSLISDVFSTLMPIKHSRAHVEEWMKPQQRSHPLLRWLTGNARVEWIPRGVVGIISPWNFPIGLTLQPLSQAFAAGNRAMIKASEHAPLTAALLKQAVAENFDPAEAVVVTGGIDVAAEFSRLPFDFLFFTGGTGTARHVLRAAAEGLVPAVLELGGKSPVVIAPEADLQQAAARIAVGKTFNAGQICLSPDYVFVPQGKERAFAEAMEKALIQLYPTLLNNDDYTSIITEHHYRRLQGYLDDARSKGAEIIEINPAKEDFNHQPHHKIPPLLLLNLNPSMRVLQEEIFGPLLPILPYKNMDDVVGYINNRPHPLAAYYFGPENAMCRYFLHRIICGGITINDVMLHVASEDLPFGGIGDSGMGYYHGRAGFETFSHARGILSAPVLSPTRLIGPPYGERFRQMLRWSCKREAEAIERRLRRSGSGASVISGQPRANVVKKNELVIITGAGSGIGRELTRLFLADGSHVLAVSLLKEELDKLAADFDPGGQRMTTLVMDLSAVDAAEKLFDYCQKNRLVVDVLVNNAGFACYGDIIDINPAKLSSMLELNVVNLTKLTHLFGKEMKSRRSGSILNVGSTAGMIPLARFAAYGASKSYINTFSFALRAEMAPYNVNVTCLIPTAVATNFAQTANIASFVGKSVLKDLFAQGKVSRTDKVAEAGYQALRQKKASIVTGNGAWLVRFFFRVMSQSMLPVLFKDM